MRANNFTNLLDTFVGKTTRGLAYIAASILFALMLLVALHVLMRYFFGFPLRGAVELIEFSMVILVFLGFGYGVYKEINVSVELFMERLPKRIQFYVTILGDFISMALGFYIIWQNILRVYSLLGSHKISGVLHIPHWPFYIILVFGFIIFEVALLNHLIKTITEAMEK